jgi:hypothetical protein
MQAIFSSQMLLYYDKATRRYIPRDGTPHNHRCENFNLNQDWKYLKKKVLMGNVWAVKRGSNWRLEESALRGAS